MDTWTPIGEAARKVVDDIAARHAARQPETGRQVIEMCREAIASRPDGAELVRRRAVQIEQDCSRAAAGDDKSLNLLARMKMTGQDGYLLADALRAMADAAETRTAP